MRSRNVLSREDRRDVHEVERFALFHGAVWIGLIVAVCVAAGVISLAWWKPFAAEREAKIENKVVVHSPQFVRGQNAQIAQNLAAAEAGGPQAVSAGKHATQLAGSIDWDEVDPGNQADLCSLDLAPANATC